MLTPARGTPHSRLHKAGKQTEFDQPRADAQSQEDAFDRAFPAGLSDRLKAKRLF
jgi:hypothetical protein